MNNETNPVTPPPVQPATPPPPQVPVPPAPGAYAGLRRKSPGLAIVLSLFPGLGHLYLGLYQRAIVVFGSFFLATVLADHAGDIGIIIAFIWFFGVIDAYRQAQMINAQEVEPPKIKRASVGSLGFGVFLIIVGIILLINNFYPIDLSWLGNWWPAILVIVGIYLIGAAYADRQKKLHASGEDDDESL
ncbi:MAG: hypothetical protein GXP48_08705 [Acidobacteria bacterium]|nr:hypothetical protein [Acidobacteriota bacterium]